MNIHVHRYSMLIQWSNQEQAYIVTVPELSGCRAQGKTYEKAVKEAQHAIDYWINTYKEMQTPIPAPSVADVLS